MRFYKYLAGFGFTLALVACGGGGGSPGSSTTTPGTNTDGTVQTSDVGSLTLDLLNGSGISASSISVIEIAQVKVTVKDKSDTVVPGIVVTFAETGVGLLKFAPAARTAMTNGSGVAVIEVRALDQTTPGATSVTATATVSGQSMTVTRALEITNTPTSGGVVDPQTLASSINFISTDPADKAIVLQGAGGNGRTETAILSYRVVDKNGTPVKGVSVDFVVNPSADVTLNISQSTTDADGLVKTSVSSKTVATAVVVKATVNGKTITTQSDQLKVTTGVGVQGGFEILPLVYNLDGALSGDSTQVTARLVDVNSNPVADGVPVVFVSTGGKIGTSAAGGCNTDNGACTVTFEVQEPRPANGIVTITGAAKVGTSTTLLRQIKLNMSSEALGIYEPSGGVPATSLNPPNRLDLLNCNKVAKQYMVANALGYSTPSGTAISVKKDATTGLSAAIDGDNLVGDNGDFSPSVFDVVVDPTGANNPSCSNTGIATTTATIQIVANASKSKRETVVPVAVTYPSGNLQLLRLNTASTPAAITLGSCSSEVTEVQVIGSDNLSIPVGAQFFVVPSDSSAAVVASTSKTVTDDILRVSSNNVTRQSLWLYVSGPNAGASPCNAGGGSTKSFNVEVTVLVNGRRNTVTIPVTYPGNS